MLKSYFGGNVRLYLALITLLVRSIRFVKVNPFPKSKTLPVSVTVRTDTAETGPAKVCVAESEMMSFVIVTASVGSMKSTIELLIVRLSQTRLVNP